MMVLAIAAEKGGVGKTTTAVNLAAYLADRVGKVLLVDMDSQGQAGMFLGFTTEGEDRAGMYEMLVFSDPLDPTYRPADELITLNVRDGLDLIPNNPRIAQAELEIAGREDRHMILAERLKEVSDRYQLVIIDVGPTVNLASLLALYAADAVIVPVAPGAATRAGVEGLRTRLRAMRDRLGYAPALMGVLATMIDRRERLSRNLVPDLQEAYGPTYAGHIRRNVHLAEAPERGLTIFEYKPRSPGAIDYMALGDWVAERAELVPSR